MTTLKKLAELGIFKDVDNSDETRTPEEICGWLTELIRKATPSTPQQACFVCGTHKTITELHHIRPVTLLAVDVYRNGTLPANIFMTLVWLCPTHHVLCHKLYDIAFAHGVTNVDALEKFAGLYELPEWEYIPYIKILNVLMTYEPYKAELPAGIVGAWSRVSTKLLDKQGSAT